VNKRLIYLFLIAILFLTLCSINNQATKISTDAENTILKVSKIYGEQNPKIINVRTTQEETTKRTMYIVSLQGNFQKGEQKSKKLNFSITKDGKKVWALTSDSWQENLVNINN
jgi:hypothetical protein